MVTLRGTPQAVSGDGWSSPDKNSSNSTKECLKNFEARELKVSNSPSSLGVKSQEFKEKLWNVKRNKRFTDRDQTKIDLQGPNERNLVDFIAYSDSLTLFWGK